MIIAWMRGRGRATQDPVFDRNGVVTPPPWRDLAGDVGALALAWARLGSRLTVPYDLPRGDGHPVLVIPGLLSSDGLIRGFRQALTILGYRAEGWGAGFNIGPTPAAWDTVNERLLGIAGSSGRRVSIVGHSLGGVMARVLATAYPELVRQVITVCSPVRLPTATRLRPLYRLLSAWHIDDDAVMTRLAEPPPVPTTAIYSPRDGIIAWASCVDDPAPGRESIAIDGPHSTMLGNPAALRIVAERLARCDGAP
jgi:PGAP1-like protein